MLHLKYAAWLSVLILGSVKPLIGGSDTIVITLDLPERIEVNVYDDASYAYDVSDAELNVVPIPDSYTAEDQECLAQNIYFEAKNQPLTGQVAVGIVTLKRVENKSFPNTICSVVKHTNYARADGFPIRHKCQFSWYCDGRSDSPANKKAHEQARQIASALLSHESRIVDFTHGADHYHADYIDPPHWTLSMIEVMHVGNHIFYTQQL